MTWRLIILGVVGMMVRLYPQESQNQNEQKAAADAVLRRAALRIYKEFGLFPTESLGLFDENIEKLGLRFHYHKPVNIQEGRILLFLAMDTIRDEINRAAETRPYLSKHPFPPSNILAEIYIGGLEGKNIPEGGLHLLEIEDGLFCYARYLPTTKEFMMPIYKETFAQALERLKDPSLPLVTWMPELKTESGEMANITQCSFVGDDGSVWHLGEKGEWIRSGH